MKKLRLISDETIRFKYGPHRYPNPFRPGTYFYETERAANTFRGLWSEVLVMYVGWLRRLPFVASAHESAHGEPNAPR